MANADVGTDSRPTIVTSSRCMVCSEYLVVLDDPYAKEPFGCANPTCPVTDDPSDWMGELE